GMTRKDFRILLNWPYVGRRDSSRNLSRYTLSRIANGLQNEELRCLAESDILWDKVVKIEEAGIEDVYDMEVAFLHNFIANGIITHNSIEQDSTIVSFIRSVWTNPTLEEILQFPENRGPDGRPLDRLKVIPVRLHVKKNRNGEIGPSVPVAWN